LAFIAEEDASLTFKQVHVYLLSQPGAVEERPFTREVPVYKIGGKMFAYSSPNDVPPNITIKLDPLHGQMLRTAYEAVRAGYHMNKEHWNTITLDGSIPEEELLSWIDESYSLVRSKLPQRIRRRLADAADG
jgi:predicted DNA-binding protein (MmcQ/YjbR family)